MKLDEDEEVCPECEGGGMVAKLYPSGHTELQCPTCMGYGKIPITKTNVEYFKDPIKEFQEALRKI